MNKRGVLFFILIVFSLSQVMPIMPVFAALDPETGFECTSDNDCILAGDGDRCSFSTRQCITPVAKGTGGAGNSCIDSEDCIEKLVCLEDKCTEAKDVGGTLTEYLTALKEPGSSVQEINLTSALAKFGVLLVWALGVKLITYTLANLVEAIEDFTVLGVFPVGSIVSIAVGGVDNMVDSLLAVWFNMLLIGVAVSLILWFGLVLVGGLFALNCGVLASEVVGKGFGIILGLTNVGFVLALVIIGFATILRLKGYAMKNTLAKLIIAVLLINFSLFFIGLFLNISNSITSAFLGREVCSINAEPPAPNTGNSTGVTAEGSTEEKVEEFTLSYWKRFNLFSVRDALRKITKENDPNVFIRVFVAPIFNLFFAAIISLVAAINIIFLIWALIVRYVTLSILIIFSPLVWLSFIFPKLGSDLGNLWKEWWSTFIKWVIFLPVFSFFLYLVKVLLNNSLNNPEEFYSQGFLAFMGQLIVILVLLFGGLFAAKKLGIAGADKAFAIAGAMTPAVLGSAARMTARKIAAGASARWARRPTGPSPRPSPWRRTPPPGGGRPGGGGGTPPPGGGRPGGGGGTPPPGGGGGPWGDPGGGIPDGSIPADNDFGGANFGGGGFGWGAPQVPLNGDENDGSAGGTPPPERPSPETFASSPYEAYKPEFPYFEPEDPDEPSSSIGSKEEGGPVPGEGTPGGAPGGHDEDWEESFATWWDNESPSPASPIPEISKRERLLQKWRESFGEKPLDKFRKNVGAGMFDASIFKAVLSAARIKLGEKHKADTREKDKKEIEGLKALKEAQDEELKARERARENEAS